MTNLFISLLVIVIISVLAPLIARLIPKQFIPETVLLIAVGAVLGPNMLGVIQSDSEVIDFLSEIGCAFLFLLAGSEINPKSLSGSDGRHGLLAWIVSFVAGLALAFIIPFIADGNQGIIATALLLTTTALGTLIPILKDKGILGTRMGDLIISYGTWGELMPILAIAVLLSARSGMVTGVILFAMFMICILIGAMGSNAVKSGSRFYQFIRDKAETNSQMTVRVVVLLLLLLVTFSSIFGFDIVLGAFAAGFVLRYIMPERGNESLEKKLQGIAHGFFVPLFFVVSGCEIDLHAVQKQPLLMVLFILTLLLIRTVPIVVSLSSRKKIREEITIHGRFSVAFYCTMALPLIVAITNIAVRNEIMTSDTASVLVAAGAVTVFLMPLLGSLTYRIVDAETGNAIKEIVHDPGSFMGIMKAHIELGHKRAMEYRTSMTEEIKKRIEDIKDPAEREDVRNTLNRHYSEHHALTSRHLAEQHDIFVRHHEELKEVYSKYHVSDMPEELFRQLEDLNSDTKDDPEERKD